MLSSLLQTLLGATFRANPAYEVVVFDRLPEHQQALLSNIRTDPDMYGVAVPRDSTAPASKAIDHDTALLFFTLQTPGRLPVYIQHLIAGDDGNDLARLVLDGLFEIERHGTFHSGAEAYAFLYGIAPQAEPTSLPARLSRDALQYAQALPIDDPMKLAARLYFYNRLPFTPIWRQRFPDQEAVDQFVGVHTGSALNGSFDQRWTRTSPPGGTKGWHMWRARRRQRNTTHSYKLYVSPDCASVPQAWQTTVAVLAESAAHSLKIGCDIYGLLRPDKIVAYFGSYADLEASATPLRRELAGCAAHGVPFTAAIGEDGLLSWGTDPPRDQQTFSWQISESWRVWVCHRLATALVLARQRPHQTIEPWRFAMERIQLEGVDVLTWTPAQTIWQASSEE
jgi:hypothetical protein